MRRIAIQPRANWRESVQAQGLTFLEVDGWELWDESAYYELGERDVEQLEGATRALVSMCGEAVDLLVREDRLHLVGIPERYREYVKKSWLLGEPSLYGRFDLAYDAKAPPKLLEYNADTPTSLIESAIVQWHWFRDRFPHLDQYNSLHEKLIAAWKRIVPRQGSVVHFACVGESIEDTLTIEYLRDTAQQAGLRAEPIAMSCIGWNAGAGEFRDEQERPVRIVFKLYPWEWLLDEEFSRFIPAAGTTWIEPAWKMILSSKAILAVLHSMFPSSPYLLPASFEEPRWDHVRKPFFSREGANIRIVRGGKTEAETPGPYAGPYVYQARVDLPRFGDRFATVGSWVVGGVDCGIGIREDTEPIISNVSPFVPHVYVPGPPSTTPPLPAIGV